MIPVVVHDAAVEEIRHAAAHYEQQRPGLGRKFRIAIQTTVEAICENSEFFAIDNDTGARACPVKKYPYTIYYLKLDECIWIAAVAHQHRRPGYWIKRRPDDRG